MDEGVDEGDKKSTEKEINNDENISPKEEKEIKENNKRKWRIILGAIFTFIVIILLVVYWFIPFSSITFENFGNSRNYNFTINNSDSEKMQFYENMRYPNNQISYKIYNCTIEKQNEMEWAFNIISNKTMLRFYPIDNYEEISIYCQEKNKIKEGMFIGGEGGPTEIIKSGKFYVINHGNILLIRASECERPNIAIHELLHTLGFDHSKNPNNIMYPILNCKQTIGSDIPILIDELYSIPEYPDLVFENASAVMRGKYLDVNINVRNNGLAKSKEAKINILVNNKTIKEIDLEPLEIGRGLSISIENIWIPKIIIKEITFYIDSPFNELEEKNNKISLR
jgi:hypothetical protein